jgi:proteasome lid subunit RPN8/RPN11
MTNPDRRGFLGITSFHVSRSCVADTYRFLRERGRRQVEGVVLWPGLRSGDRIDVAEAVVPAQTAYRTEHGLRYEVHEDELARIGDDLSDRGLVLPIQVHSHPGEAYHSELDDARPVVGTVGGLSIVIPDFGFGPRDPELWAVYRLYPGEGWTRLSAAESRVLLVVT